jgi:hypothetical protein
MDTKQRYRERLRLGAVILIVVNVAAWLSLSGTADRWNAWLYGLWPF